MSLKKRIFIILFFVIAGFLVLEYAIFQFLVYPGFLALERQEARKEVDRCIGAIRREIQHLDAVCHDWAAWDDTREFVQDENREYIQANLIPESFSDNKLNVINIYNREGALVWGEGRNLVNGERITVRELPAGTGKNRHPLLDHEDTKSMVRGLMITEFGPMIFSSRPILTSDNQGPIRGTMIIGRFLDKDMLDTLREQLYLRFQVSPMYGPSVPPENLEIQKEMRSGDSYHFRESGRYLISVYTPLADFEGKRALFVRAEVERNISIKGGIVMRIALLSTILVGALVLIILQVFLQKTVAKPISTLKEHVRVMGESRDLKETPLFERNDEIGELAAEFNRMIRQIFRSDRIYREVIEQASGVPYRLYYIDGGRYEFMGDGILNLMELSPTDVTREKIEGLVREVRIIDPKAPPVIEEYWEQFRNGQVTQYRVDLRIETPSGREKWISDTSVPLLEERTGKVIGSLGILQDITQRIRMEEASRRQQEKLVQTEKLVSLGTLVSGVAHEINNPNNFITLNAPILAETWESIEPILEEYYQANGDFLLGGVYYSKMRKHVPDLFSGIVTGANRIKNIVRELRNFARKSPSDIMAKVDINSVINSAMTLLDNMIRKSTNHFRLECGDHLPPVKGHFQRLEQVVINLLQNACQALSSKDQKIIVRTSYREVDRKIIVTVEDEGCGIPEDIGKYIMDPFFTTRRDSGGMGLGLSISSRIVNDHGGILSLDSHPEKGTRAVMELPAMNENDA